MPRGGKRRGAGRPFAVDLETASDIRRDCEQRANVLRREQAHRRILRRLAKRGIVFGEDGAPNPVEAVPLNYRQIVIECARNHRARTSHLPVEIIYAIEVIRDARRAAKVPDGKSMGLRVTAPLPRLYKGRSDVIRAVAQSWEVSERTVRSIWEGPSLDI